MQIGAMRFGGFQFTHPGRGATLTLKYSLPDHVVSIHAPREGCDSDAPEKVYLSGAFQFTHPGRGATDTGDRWRYWRVVSIHAPREGCDLTIEAKCLLSQVSIHAPREGCDIR